MERTEEIETLAYFLWQNAGEPAGTAERDWLFAQHVVETGSVSAPDWSYTGSGRTTRDSVGPSRCRTYRPWLIMTESHPPRERLLAYCDGTANAVGVWVMECHLLLCRECRDSVAEIDRAEGHTRRHDHVQPPRLRGDRPSIER